MSAFDSVEPVDYHAVRETLWQEGVRVQITHLRQWRYRVPDSFLFLSVGEFKEADSRDAERALISEIIMLDAKGGATRCRLFAKETGELLAEGETRVHEEDHYCKKIGRDLALARALAVLHENETAEAKA